MNAKLKKHIRIIINDLIEKESRTEAMAILEKSDEKKVGEFLYYYHSDMGNIACLVLDTAKNILVKNKKMKQRKKDSFGMEIDWDAEIANDFELNYIRMNLKDMNINTKTMK